MVRLAPRPRRHPETAIDAPSREEKNWFALLRESNRYPILSAAEERVWLEKSVAGDIRAAQKLCSHNLHFVVKVANGFRGRGLPLQDLVNEGAEGLMIAAQRFELSRKSRFLTYAVWWVRQRMIHALHEKARTIQLTWRENAALWKLHYADRVQRIGGESYPDAPSDLMDAANAAQPLSLSQTTADGICLEDSLESPLEAPDAFLVKRDQARTLAPLLTRLDQRERQAISLLFGLKTGNPMTLDQVGTILGVCRERVRQIRNTALKKMRWKQTKE